MKEYRIKVKGTLDPSMISGDCIVIDTYGYVKIARSGVDVFVTPQHELEYVEEVDQREEH